jgi:hypothetical protein
MIPSAGEEYLPPDEGLRAPGRSTGTVRDRTLILLAYRYVLRDDCQSVFSASSQAESVTNDSSGPI